jgi:hypothetical protein
VDEVRLTLVDVLECIFVILQNLIEHHYKYLERNLHQVGNYDRRADKLQMAD